MKTLFCVRNQQKIVGKKVSLEIDIDAIEGPAHQTKLALQQTAEDDQYKDDWRIQTKQIGTQSSGWVIRSTEFYQPGLDYASYTDAGEPSSYEEATIAPDANR